MLLTNAHTHKFLTVTFRSFVWCDWCKRFIWGLGKQGLRCVECNYKIHKKCEASIMRNSDEHKKRCKTKERELLQGERPTFRFKVSRGGKDALIEIDPNRANMITYTSKDRQVIQCSRIVVEKPVTNPKKLLFHLPDATKTTVVCGTHREREQLAACLAFLSHRVTKSISTTPLRIFVGMFRGCLSLSSIFTSSNTVFPFMMMFLLTTFRGNRVHANKVLSGGSTTHG